MKTNVLSIFLIFIFLLPVQLSAQFNNQDSVNSSKKNFDIQINHFLKKSKTQKNIAWGLIGGSFLLSTLSTSSTNNINTSGNLQSVAVLSNIASIASIPLFFSASNNKNKAKLIDFEKDIAHANSDSLKKRFTEDAAVYFFDKSRSNNTTAIILSAIGGAFIVAGLSHNNRPSDDFFSDAFDRAIYTAAGITLGALSIPFYVRGSNLKRTANGILRTGRIPRSDLGSISPSVKSGQYVAVGISVQL